MDKQKDFMKQLQELEMLANEMDDYSDALESMPQMDQLMGEFSGMDAMAAVPGMMGMSMPGEPKDIMLYDTVVVHGLRGDYRLTFEETEEGLVINMVK